MKLCLALSLATLGLTACGGFTSKVANTDGQSPATTAPSSVDLSVFFGVRYTDGKVNTWAQVQRNNTGVALDGFAGECAGQSMAYDAANKSFSVSQPSDGAFDALSVLCSFKSADRETFTASTEVVSIKLASISDSAVRVGEAFDLVATGPAWGDHDHLDFWLVDKQTGAKTKGQLIATHQFGLSFQVQVLGEQAPGDYTMLIERSGVATGLNHNASLNLYYHYLSPAGLPLSILAKN